MTIFANVRNNQIIDFNSLYLDEDIERIETTKEIQDAYDEDKDKVIFQDGEIILNPHYEEEKAKKERERILKLSVTKSDFFDATIMAFGLDYNDLLPIVAAIIQQAEVDDKLKKIALNNYQNAKDFYRNHEIFNVIAGVPIVISEGNTITITSEQFDRYFDKASKKDAEAYKELLPKEGD